MKTISARTNPEFKAALRLHDRRERRQTGLTLLEGEKLIGAALATGAVIERLFMSTHWDESAAAAWADRHVPAAARALLTPALVRELTGLDTPSQVIAVVRAPGAADAATVCAGARSLVVLDRIQDPGNLGTIVRTADALGADGVLALPGTCDLANPKAVRASMGAAFRVPFAEIETSTDIVALLRRHGLVCLATAADGDNLRRIELPERVAWFFGAEGQGLAPALAEVCARRVAIPMRAGAESLNVAAAVAICLFAQNPGERHT